MKNNKKSNFKSKDKTKNEAVITQDIEKNMELINEDLDAVQGGAAPILGPKN